MPIAKHIIMDEEDARAALVEENKQLKEKLGKAIQIIKSINKDYGESSSVKWGRITLNP